METCDAVLLILSEGHTPTSAEWHHLMAAFPPQEQLRFLQHTEGGFSAFGVISNELADSESEVQDRILSFCQNWDKELKGGELITHSGFHIKFTTKELIKEGTNTP